MKSLKWVRRRKKRAGIKQLWSLVKRMDYADYIIVIRTGPKTYRVTVGKESKSE